MQGNQILTTCSDFLEFQTKNSLSATTNFSEMSATPQWIEFWVQSPLILSGRETPCENAFCHMNDFLVSFFYESCIHILLSLVFTGQTFFSLVTGLEISLATWFDKKRLICKSTHWNVKVNVLVLLPETFTIDFGDENWLFVQGCVIIWKLPAEGVAGPEIKPEMQEPQETNGDDKNSTAFFLLLKSHQAEWLKNSDGWQSLQTFRRYIGNSEMSPKLGLMCFDRQTFLTNTELSSHNLFAFRQNHLEIDVCTHEPCPHPYFA